MGDKLDGKIFASSARQKFARSLLKILIEQVILKREYIDLPTAVQ